MELGMDRAVDGARLAGCMSSNQWGPILMPNLTRSITVEFITTSTSVEPTRRPDLAFSGTSSSLSLLHGRPQVRDYMGLTSVRLVPQ